MNERIKELADQAWKCAEHPSIPRDFDMGIFEKKFAELIIRECADVCRDDGRWFQEQDDKVEAGVAYALAYKIEERFGVKK